MSEQVYDEIVAPMLLEVLKICHEHGMPITATVEYATGEFGTSADLPADRSLPMDWAYVAARSNGNADVLIGHLVSQAEVRGHGSVYLKQLGVPTFPPAKEGEMATVRDTICKPFRVGGSEVTSAQIADAIDKLADLPRVFKASDLLPSILPGASYHLQQEAMNRLFQRWRKLGLTFFDKGLWSLEGDAWNQMQLAAMDARIPA